MSRHYVDQRTLDAVVSRSISHVLRFTPDDSLRSRGDGWLGSWVGLLSMTASVVIAAINDWGWLVGRREVDFAVYIMGAHHLTSSNLYLQHLATGPRLPFTYPPFATLVFWPLAQLPFKVASVVWGGINLVALFVVVGVTLRTLRPSERGGHSSFPWRPALLCLGPAALLEPVMLNMSFGQINIVITALIIVDVTGRYEIAGRSLPRGLLVGFAAAIKLTPLIFVAYFLVTKQWRAAKTATATFMGCAVVLFLLNPRASIDFWTIYSHDVRRIGGAAYISNQSAQGAIDRLSHHVWNPTLFTPLELVVLLVGLLAAYRLFARGQRFLAFLLITTAGYLVSPITWCHHMIVIVAVVAWLWWGELRDRGSRHWAVAVTGLFYWAPMWHIPNDGRWDLREHGWSLLAGSSYFFACVAFLAFGLWHSFRASPPLAHQELMPRP